MRTLVLLLAFLPFAAFAQSTAGAKPAAAKGIKWLTIEEAQEAAKKDPRPLFVDVYTNWCGPCKMLDRNTFSDPRVAEYVNRNFHPVKFNAESGDPVTWKGEPGFRSGTHGRPQRHAPPYLPDRQCERPHRLPHRGVPGQ